MIKRHQREGADFLKEKGRAILADEMGLGKTLTALTAAIERDAKRILIVSPKFALGVWKAEIEKWFPGVILPFIYTGGPNKRMDVGIKAGTASRLGKTTALIANIEVIHEIAHSWDCVILDEVHYKLRNRRNKAFSKAAEKARNSKALFLLSGTPVVKGPEDLWPYLNLIDPRTFSSYWGFVYEYCHVIKGYFGLSIEGAKDPVALRGLLNNYMVRHKKSDAFIQLPPKTRQPIWLEMKPKQKQLYDQIVTDLLAELPGDEILLIPTVLAQITRLRQTLISPSLYDGPEDSAALDAFAEIRESTPEHIVVFTPYKKAIDLIAKRMKSPLLRIHGGLSSEQIVQTVRSFQEAKANTYTTLACTIQSALSFF
jgi:SNF2 family DNA or RNA helicase